MNGDCCTRSAINWRIKQKNQNHFEKKKKKKKKKVIDQSIELSEKKMVEEEEHKDIDRSRHGRQQESDLPTNRQIATDTDQ